MPNEKLNQTHTIYITSPETNDSDNRRIEFVVRARSKSLLFRLGCGFLLIIWFLVLLLPLAMLILAAEREIRIPQPSGIPDRHEHPLWQITLINEVDYRGLQVTSSTVKRNGENALCIQTNIRYLLWYGKGEAARYCDCYERSDLDTEWQFAGTSTGACKD